MSKALPFKLFSCCILVKGYSRSIICDTQRNKFDFIPNALYQILIEFDGKLISEVIENYVEQSTLIAEYFDFLHANEYIFFTPYPEQFPECGLDYDDSALITNAIIDLSGNIIGGLDKSISELSDLGCSHLQIRSYSIIPLSFISDLLQKVQLTRISSVELIIKYSSEIDDNQLINIANQYSKVNFVFVHSAPQEKTLSEIIFHKTQEITSSLHCGNINPHYFTPNFRAISESVSYNSCLNKKISIDINGDIKNCPTMTKSFGNILTTNLRSVIDLVEFKKVWSINKNCVSVCKDCEFRLICTDCRALKEDPGDDYSKPLKCGYDPYKCEWGDWSKNELKVSTFKTYCSTTTVE